MKIEQVVELIEKLVDEKVKLAAIVASKTLGTNRAPFMEDSHRRIALLKAGLIEALKTEG